MIEKLLKNEKNVIYRKMGLAIFDIAAIYLAAFFTLFIRFEFTINDNFTHYFDIFLNNSALVIVITLSVFYIFKLYSSLWIYASFVELKNIGKACVFSVLIQIAISSFTNNKILGMPNSYFIIYPLILFAIIFISRFIYREIRDIRNRKVKCVDRTRIMIIGAGDAGAALIKEIKSSSKGDKKIIGLIDDNPNKIGNYLDGIKVFGMIEDIPEMVEKHRIDQLLIAIPSATKQEIKRIVDICKDTGKEIMKLPGMYQLINGEVSISQLKKIDLDDLLGRDKIETDLDAIMSYVSGKVVMVTGGGGSIGSELCRQIANYKPKQLVIFDNYENTTYSIQHELKYNYPELNLVVLIGSVRNVKRINSVLEQYQPDIIYHAAAHKHVPLMEDSPNEAIQNNVVGTLKIAEAADRWNVEKFVMISTDKAVNPTNVMGASKRICEMIVQTFNNKSETEFVAVRFGNVLGSNGSVIPLFEKQIRDGGPVTVTHADVTRYFMTIPEAVALVLQAGSLAKGGEIFVLDMGDPVKIDDLAKNLILLSGLKPGVDIGIEYIGLRRGEKLYEELLMDEEGLEKTENDLIFIGKPMAIEESELLKKLSILDVNSEMEPENIRKFIKDIVPTYISKPN
ncbi:MAG: polysaccharide biosynthesis protein [Clostridiales bacterium]|nr:polysaccharide biosynthesis protein [Clostridiales bacterium]